MIVPCPSCTSQNRVAASKLAQRPRCGQCKRPLSPLSITSPADFDELITTSPLPVMVDFWAAWCGPCRMVAPEVEKLSEEYKGQLVVAKLDTDAVPAIAARYSIRSIPTIMLFRDGRPARTVAGAMPRARIAEELGLGAASGFGADARTH